MEYDKPDFKNYPEKLDSDKYHLTDLTSSNVGNVLDVIDEEGAKDFKWYVQGLNLNDNRDFVILPSSHYYFYTKEDVQNVNTVINIKQLNHEKNLKSFIRNIFNILPIRSMLVGRFVDNDYNSDVVNSPINRHYRSLERKEFIDNGIESTVPFLNKVIDLLDFRTNKFLNKNLVSRLLENNGFVIVDMQELNGVTYFCSQKIHSYVA